MIDDVATILTGIMSNGLSHTHTPVVKCQIFQEVWLNEFQGIENGSDLWL